MAIGLVSAFFSGYGYGISVTTTKYKAVIAELESAYAKDNQERYQAIAEAERKARMRLQQETERVRELMRQLKTVRQTLMKERKVIKEQIHDVSQMANEYCVGLPVEWVQLYNQALGLTRPHSGTRGEDLYSSDIITTAGSTSTTASRVRILPLGASDTRPTQTYQPVTYIQRQQKQGIRIQDAGLQQDKGLQQPSMDGQGPEVRWNGDPEKRGISVNYHVVSVTQEQAYGADNTFDGFQEQEVLVTPKELLAHIQDYGLYCRTLEIQLRSIAELLEARQ